MSEKDSSNNSMDNNPQQDDINQLIQEKERLVSEGKYLEANELKIKIQDLKNKTKTTKKKEMDNNQEAQNQQLVDLYQDEVRNLSLKWDKEIEEFIEKNKDLEEKCLDMEKKIKELNFKIIEYNEKNRENEVQCYKCNRKELREVSINYVNE